MSEELDKYIKFPFDKFTNTDGSNALSIDRIVYRSNDRSNNFTRNLVTTDFHFELTRNRFSDNKSAIIICSKDNKQVLKYSLSKIKEFGIDNNLDILLVDDRSSSLDILELSDEFNTSYLRIDNSDNIFNYSVINNIAVSYLKYYGKQTIIFYNNDMWPSNPNTLKNILDKHDELNSDLTGCRLVYPTEIEYLNLGKPKHVLDTYINQAFNTIQHGGIFFTIRKSNFNPSSHVCFPNHIWRFYPHDQNMACVDSRCFAITGALHITNIDKFINIGGLSPSLSSTFQDIDLCMRYLQNNMSINYIGSEYMYHAESITISNDNVHKGEQFLSDNIVWDYLWNNKITNLLGLQFNT